MEWTREKTLALINEYRKRRGLWDMTHEDYRKKDIKSKLMLEVSNSLGGGIPILEIEKKFHTLRTQYHRELNRIKRKEPYNSKWFGFNNLQFLSSPKACRSNNKGRVKEITEDGTVTTKYILREAQLDNNIEQSPNYSNNTSDAFLTIHQRKPQTTTISYDTTAATSRSHELEKLIEETTKDVDMEDAKPKTIEPNTYVANSHSDVVSVDGGEQELQAVESVTPKLHDDQMETIDNSSGNGVGEETELNYQTNNANHELSSPMHHYIKIQRRENDSASEFYDDNQHPSSHIHSIVSSNGKRIYYDTNGQTHTATILAPSSATSAASQVPNSNTMLNTTSPPTKIHHTTIKHVNPQRSSVVSSTPKIQEQQQLQPPLSMSSQTFLRDEFLTYGEYVSNEMRSITNREILIALKHKINTALFEASMAELQK